MKEKGENHHVRPRGDTDSTCVLLDLPLPLALDTRSWVCRPCKERALTSCEHGQAMTYYPVLEEDILKVCPGARKHICKGRPPACTTGQFRMFLLHTFYNLVQHSCCEACGCRTLCHKCAWFLNDPARCSFPLACNPKLQDASVNHPQLLPGFHWRCNCVNEAQAVYVQRPWVEARWKLGSGCANCCT